MHRILLWALAVSAALCLSAATPAAAKKSGLAEIVLLYHPDCAPCRHEAKILPGIAQQYSDVSFVMIVLHDEDKQSRRPNMRRAANLQIRYAQDSTETLMKRYGNEFKALPYSVAYDADTNACGQHFGVLTAKAVGKWQEQC